MKSANITITAEGVFTNTGVRKSGALVGQIQKTMDPKTCSTIYRKLLESGKKTNDQVTVFSTTHRVFTKTSVSSFAEKAALGKPLNITFGSARSRI